MGTRRNERISVMARETRDTETVEASIGCQGGDVHSFSACLCGHITTIDQALEALFFNKFTRTASTLGDVQGTAQLSIGDGELAFGPVQCQNNAT